MKVLIAGAGLGGLTAAACLLRAGFDVEVYEQAPALGEIGAGIQLSANAMHVMNDLGLGEKLGALAVQPSAYIFRLHDTGEVLSQFPLAAAHLKANGAPYNQLHRADLHQALVECAAGLKKDAVHLNKTVTGFSEDDSGVTLRFADGSSARGDVLVGSDGVKSAVRAQIAGAAKAAYSGDAAWRFIVPIEKLPAGLIEPAMSVWMGPGAHIVTYYLRAGALVNFVGLVETDEVSEESWTAKFPWERLKADYVGWHPILQTMIDNADRTGCFRWSLFYRQPIDNWSTRRATMMGDAVHATLPYLAQGAAMAIEDSAVLTRCLKMERNVTDALQRYQRNRIERTARIVKGSDGNRTLFHMRDQTAMRAAFKSRDEGAARNAWLYSYNPLTVDLP